VRYFIEKLIDCKDLNARRVDQSISLRFRSVRANDRSPNVYIGAIFNDEQWKVIGMALISKA
jgi:hypothetical protein